MRFLTPLLALGLALSAPASASSDAALLSLWSSGAGYESSLSALVSDPDVDSAWLASLSSHADWRVRHQAAVALGWRDQAALFEQLSTQPPLKTRAGFPRFVGDWRAEPAAASALLDRFLRGGEDVPTQKALIEAMVHTDGDYGEALAALLPQQQSVELRVVMAAALRDAPGTSAVAALVAALGDADPEVREEAARSLGWRADSADDVGAVDGLLTACADAHDRVRAAAARALGWLEVGRAADTLAGMVTDADADVRLHALRGLHRVAPDDAAALPALADLLQDTDHRVARLARTIAGG